MSRPKRPHDPEAALSVRGLKTWFFTDAGVLPSVDDVSFDVPAGGTLCVVGESGCGKSVTALSILGLVPSPPGRIVGGEAIFRGENVLEFDNKELRELRGNDIAMIFQEPMTSLNPVYTVGNQLEEAARLHLGVTEAEARERAIDMLRQVGIPAPEQRVDEYPHQMSGGMKQRVMIAMALMCGPELLIADEPTTALDVTIQAQILELLASLQKEREMSMLMITHDMAVVAEVADRVVVMYAGHVVEDADVALVFQGPMHPYTSGLFRSIPSLNPDPGSPLATIPGTVPAPLEFPTGCRFRSRCTYATSRCAAERPELRAVRGDAHRVACHHAEAIADGTAATSGPTTDRRVERIVAEKNEILRVEVEL